MHLSTILSTVIRDCVFTRSAPTATQLRAGKYWNLTVIGFLLTLPLSVTPSSLQPVMTPIALYSAGLSLTGLIGVLYYQFRTPLPSARARRHRIKDVLYTSGVVLATVVTVLPVIAVDGLQSTLANIALVVLLLFTLTAVRMFRWMYTQIGRSAT